MIYKANRFSQVPASNVVGDRCPSCRQWGTFDPIGVPDVSLSDGHLLSLRRCPYPACNGAILFVSKQGKVVDSFPALTIDFDTTNVPAAVTSAFEEAIMCHAVGCFVASAIMVRKTLEELCSERGAVGSDLKERIRALGTKIVIPAELLAGLDDLRLLGNDAAHIESKEYEKVGKEEVEVGIEFAKEVLKAVYQYSTLLSRLRGLKKPE